MTEINLEGMLFEYMDQIKLLISPEAWGSAVLECTKNEVFILLLLYRQSDANMTQIAEYIEVPLNTATGVVARMERRKLVSRQRSQEDKRVVTISLTENGRAQIQEIMKEFMYYGQKLMHELEPEELALIGSIFEKLIRILKEESRKVSEPVVKKVKKIRID